MLFVHRASPRAPARASPHLAAPQAADHDRVADGTTPPVRLHMHLSARWIELCSISSTFPLASCPQTCISTYLVAPVSLYCLFIFTFVLSLCLVDLFMFLQVLL